MSHFVQTHREDGCSSDAWHLIRIKQAELPMSLVISPYDFEFLRLCHNMLYVYGSRECKILHNILHLQRNGLFRTNGG